MSKWKDGLPPVGEVCKAAWLIPPDGGDMEPVVIEVVAYSGDKVWLSCCGKDEVMNVGDVTFYSLKSEADHKRGEAVDGLFKIIKVNYEYHPHVIAEEVADAGYRKVTPLTDEQIKEFCSPLLDATEYHRVFEAIKWARSQILGEES